MLILRDDVSRLAGLVDMMLERDLSAIASGDPYDARIAESRQEECDRASEAIEENTIALLTLQQPIFAADLRFLVAVLTVAQRLQRVAHGAEGVAGLAIDLSSLGAPLAPPDALLDLGRLARDRLRDAISAFSGRDGDLAARVVAGDSEIDARYRALRDDLLQRLGAAGGDAGADEFMARRLTFWLWIAHKLERVADHAVVIARRTQQML